MGPLSVELSSEHLVLRPFRETDGAQAYRNWQKDPEVFRYLDQDPVQNRQESIEYCRERTLYYKIPYFFDWVITEKDTDLLIGEFNAAYSRRRNEVSVGFCLGSAWWNRGYMSELLPVMCRFFRQDAGIERIKAECFRDNSACRHVLEKSGFVLKGYEPGQKLYYFLYDLK